MDEDTSRIIYATPRDSVEQGVHLSPDPEKDTAKPVVLVAISLKNTNFITKIRTGLLKTGDDTMTTPSTSTSTLTPSFQTRSTSSGGRIQTKQMLDTSRSRRNWTV